MLYYKVEEFMLDLFPNKFAKSNVFSLLYGVKTWRGSTRKLADALRMPESSLRSVMGELIAEGYIRKTDDGYQCAYAAQQSAQSEDDPAQLSAATAQNCATPAPLPPTPPITKNIKKEKENLIVRDQIATQNPPSSSFLFEELVNAYRQRSGESQLSLSEINVARNAWHTLNPPTQKMLLAELQKPGGWCGKRLLWTITDYEPPKPINYNGHWDADRLMKERKLCCARMKGEEAYGIYLYEDALLWDMEIKYLL